MAIIDIFPLVQSPQFLLNYDEEARVDLILRKRPCEPKTKLVGKVTTRHSMAIPNAIITVMDWNYNPIAFTKTDTSGKYVFENILKPGVYRITATANGFLTAQMIYITIDYGITKTVNINLRKDPAKERGCIYGIIKNAHTKKTIKDVLIFLLDGHMRKVAETSSNMQGQYLINGIKPGRYTVIMEKKGYVRKKIIVLVDQGLFVKSDILLVKKHK